MLIVAVANSETGDMLQVRPVRDGRGFRCRSPTIQSAPADQFHVEHETGVRSRKCRSEPQRLNDSSFKRAGVTFTESEDDADDRSSTDYEYTTASDTDQDESQITITADIETVPDEIYNDDSDNDDNVTDEIPFD